MKSWNNEYLDKYYRNLPGWVDGTTQFHELCKKYIYQESKVLEIGPGASNETSKFLSNITKELIGLDIDDIIKKNIYVSKAFLYKGDRFPFPSNSFDVVVSNYVNEHIKNPDEHLKEVYRVLKKNGLYIFRTPNIYYYVTIVSKFSPHWFHKLIANRLRNLPEDYHDPYPTYYKFNSRRKCIELLTKNDFRIIEIVMIEKEPLYGLSLRVLFFLFMAYERIVNSTRFFSSLRSTILCITKKL